jgi:GR25 family glycosyltransferase involved in LPS biosynthesis
MQSNYKRISTKTVEGRELLDRQHMGQTGCYMSHYRLIKETAENYDLARKELLSLLRNPGATQEDINKAELKVKKYSNVLILEDDNEFGMILDQDVTVKGKGNEIYSDKLTLEGAGRFYYEAMRDLHEDWDMLYFMAMSYKTPLDTNSPNLKKLTHASCLNAYAINAKMYPRILSQLNKIEHDFLPLNAVDEEIAKLHKQANCYVFTQALAVQDGRGSTINNFKSDDPKLRYWQTKTK